MLDTLSSLIPSQADLLWNLATSAAGYVLMSLALLRLSRALSLPHPAFAWIPFLNYYRLGQIADLYTDNRMTDDAKCFTATNDYRCMSDNNNARGRIRLGEPEKEVPYRQRSWQ